MIQDVIMSVVTVYLYNAALYMYYPCVVGAVKVQFINIQI